MPGRSKRDRDADDLTLREQLFGAYVVIEHGNGTEAARKAGYKGDCRKRACELLQRPRVQQVIEREKQRLLNKLQVTKEKVIAELARVAFFDPRELFNADGSLKPTNEFAHDTAAVISGIEVRHGATKLRFASKLNALDLLGRYLKLWDGSGNSSGDRLKEVIDAMKAGPVEQKKESIQ